MPSRGAVSYTHLDVYKRQVMARYHVQTAYEGFKVRYEESRAQCGHYNLLLSNTRITPVSYTHLQQMPAGGLQLVNVALQLARVLQVVFHQAGQAHDGVHRGTDVVRPVSYTHLPSA